MSKYLELLQEADIAQKEAINRQGHCIVRAGPGTGKTRTLVLKATKLLYEEVFSPRGLACVTYTQSMAGELKRQLKQLGVLPHDNVFIGTIHSFCLLYVLLPFAKIFGYRLPNPVKVASDSEQTEMYRDIWDRYKLKDKISPYGPEFKDGKLVESLPTKLQKYRRTHVDGANAKDVNPYIEELLAQYESALLAKSCVDFDLLVKWAMQLIEQENYVRQSLEAKFPWLLIDEYQDVGLPLHRMVKALVQHTNIQLFAIGDPNQCIYSFSGAHPRFLKELCSNVEKYGSTISLLTNHRSYARVIDAASAIAPSPMEFEIKRIEKVGIARVIKNTSTVELLREIVQEKLVPYDEVMILHRSWKDYRNTVSALKKQAPDIPFYEADKQVYDPQRPLTEWITKLMRFSDSGGSTADLKFREICYLWTELLHLKGLPRYEAASLQSKVKLWTALQAVKEYQYSADRWLSEIEQQLGLNELLKVYQRKYPQDVEEYDKLRIALHSPEHYATCSIFDIQSRIERKNQVYIGTLHSSKGQQSQVVIIVNADALNTIDPELQEENRRLLFVGITRAKDQVYIIYNNYSYLANKIHNRLKLLS
jgi:DNA helicase II / ATP-dependent DNA helicase PcrA